MAPSRLASGSIFADAFRVIDVIGQGSMGTVYEVERVSDAERLALKLIDLQSADDPRTVRRFEREVQAGMEIESPYVARTLGSGRDEARGLAWMALELARGPTLESYIRERAPLTFESAREIVEQLFDAVAAAHRAGIVHRDLKPDNIRVDERDRRPSIKVLDFGIAKSIAGLDISGTTPGLGTPLWTAPEQAKDGYVPAPDADVWALGLLVFFVLTGRIFWEHAGRGGTVLDLAVEISKSPIPKASQRAETFGALSSLPPGFDAWFESAVTREPAKRWPDAGRAREAWDALLLPPTESPDLEMTERGRPVKRTGLLLFALITTCVAMGYTIYWLLKTGHS